MRGPDGGQGVGGRSRMAKARGGRGRSKDKGTGKGKATKGTGGGADKDGARPDPLEALRKERDDLEDRLVYMTAEFENLKRRSQRDTDTRVQRMKECLMLDLLTVVDNLERALAQAGSPNPSLEDFAKGVRMIGLQLEQVLRDNGLAPIETEGQAFDPFKHEAVERVEDMERQDGLIIEEVLRGYTLNGKVVRPSKVRVNVHPAGTRTAEDDAR